LTIRQQHVIITLMEAQTLPNQLLSELGFSVKETSIYLAILQSGKITPAQIAKLTKINRTTVYAVAKELQRRGVISEDLGSTPAQLIALPPEDLANIIRNDEKDLESKRVLVDKAIEGLSSLAKATKYQVPKIVFIEEEQLEDYLYKQTPLWNKSLLEVDPTWWGFQDPSLVEHYQGWIDWYWQEANPTSIDLKLLTSQGDIEQEMKKREYLRRQIKFWKEATDFSATTWINGDYVVMIMTSARPHYLVEIHDKVMAHNLRQLFKGIWNSI
jgi:hypothetical protein